VHCIKPDRIDNNSYELTLFPNSRLKENINTIKLHNFCLLVILKGRFGGRVHVFYEYLA
jgi:hypothetical protein